MTVAWQTSALRATAILVASAALLGCAGMESRDLEALMADPDPNKGEVVVLKVPVEAGVMIEPEMLTSVKIPKSVIQEGDYPDVKSAAWGEAGRSLVKDHIMNQSDIKERATVLSRYHWVFKTKHDVPKGSILRDSDVVQGLEKGRVEELPRILDRETVVAIKAGERVEPSMLGATLVSVLVAKAAIKKGSPLSGNMFTEKEVKEASRFEHCWYADPKDGSLWKGVTAKGDIKAGAMVQADDVDQGDEETPDTSATSDTSGK